MTDADDDSTVTISAFAISTLTNNNASSTDISGNNNSHDNANNDAKGSSNDLLKRREGTAGPRWQVARRVAWQRSPSRTPRPGIQHPSVSLF